MEYLNVNVIGEWMVSVPLKTEKQIEASKRVSQGMREAQTFIILEPKARDTNW